jgi:AcrR family transcriptional regulator
MPTPPAAIPVASGTPAARTPPAPRAVPADEPPKLALRERNKQDKRERIRAAAAELFTRQGYGSATLRDIAQHAGVGLGTLFNYAADKRDLVFLIFNDELNRLTDETLALPTQAPLLEQLVAIFKRHYDYFASRPELSRILLQELTFYSEGKHSLEFQAIRQRLIEGVGRRVADAQATGGITQQESAEMIARLLFFTYSAAVRWWIAAPQPEAGAGMAELARLLKLQMEGLAT